MSKIDAVVTLVSTDVDEDGNAYPVTRVYRMEFESDEQAQMWLVSGAKEMTLDGIEVLIAKQ
jgi:hypothetical protein